MMAALCTVVSLAGLTGCQGRNGGAGGSASKAVQASVEPARYDLAEPDALPPRLNVPLQQRDPYLLMPATVNGRRAGSFLLDTGSALDAIGVGLANQLELPERPGGTAIGIAGRREFQYRPVAQWQLNDIAMPSEKLAGLNLGPINKAAPFRSPAWRGIHLFVPCRLHSIRPTAS
jgi:hypothetical protein